MSSRSAVRVALAGMLALAVGMGIGRFAFTPLLPMMQRDEGLGLELAGWLAAANYLGYLAGALAAMRMRLPAARVVRASLVAVCVLTVAMGVFESTPARLVLRAGAGVASAWVLVFASALVLRALGARDRGHLGALVFSGVGLGTALTGLVCVVLLARAWSADGAWMALGVVAAALATLCWGGLRDSPGAAPASSGQGARVGAIAACWPLILCYGCFGFGYIVPATFLPAMARETIADAAVYGWAWPVFGLAACLATLASGWLGRHLSNRELWGASQLLLALGVALPVLWPGLAAIAASALLVGGTFMVVTSAAMQEAVRLGAGGTALLAAMTAAFATGQVLGPAAVSLLAAGRAGLEHTLLAAAALLVVSAVPVLRWRSADAVRDERRPRAAPAAARECTGRTG